MNTAILFSNKIAEKEKALDEILANITLTNPKGPWSLYSAEQCRMKKKEELNFKEIAWKDLPVSEQNVYKEKYEQEKEKYKSDYAIVKKMLIDPELKEGLSPFRFFSDKCIQDAIENGRDESSAMIHAKEMWLLKKDEEKLKWEVNKNMIDQWIEDAKKISSITAYSVFVNKHINKIDGKSNVINIDKEMQLEWKDLPIDKQNNYIKLAERIIQETKRNLNLYELINHSVPSKPYYCIRYFYAKFKNSKLADKKRNLQHYLNEWDTLNDLEKEKYVKLDHRERLKYKYKMINYRQARFKNNKNDKNRKELKIEEAFEKKYSNCISYFISEQIDKTMTKGMTFLDLCIKKWCQLPTIQKDRYKEQAEIAKKEITNKYFDDLIEPKEKQQVYVDHHLKKIKSKVACIETLTKCSTIWNEPSLSKIEQHKAFPKNENDKGHNPFSS